MAHRIEVLTKVNDTRSQVALSHLQSLGYKLTSAKSIDVYTINKELQNIDAIAKIISNPISQTYTTGSTEKSINFDFALEIGFLPGVTDNIATTAKETIEDFIKEKFKANESVHTSTLLLLKGEISKGTTEEIGKTLANDLIQSISIKSKANYDQENGMDTIVPTVKIHETPHTDTVDLNISPQDLALLSKEGIKNEDGTRRGPLALEPEYMDAIKKYYAKEDRNPTDIELESLAQTWSEHCKHTIFAAEIDDNPQGLYKGYIKKATNEIREEKGSADFCVSVFNDNSGGIIFDENWIISDKAETHNSPSALDPFGGAITGIVGVNRDCIGFGQGAKPIINKYGFCVGNPNDQAQIFRDRQLTTPALPPKRIFEGIIDGVNVGGNCSGIPTPQGFVYFDDSYKGKPLVFVGTVGLMPRVINGRAGWEKSAKNGDKVVVVGGRVGQDGIHGATFSSEALAANSPATAVQIGDPITQKKLSDAIIKEARDLNLYNSITDCGAGGISCSISEMAKESGGCMVDLDKVPLKYPNLDPWKIWISESQERMTLSIPPEKVDQFISLMEKRGVEAMVVGEFNNSGRCQVTYNNEMIMDLEMDFLHDGLPKKHITTAYTKPNNKEPNFDQPEDLNKTLKKMLNRPNLSSYEFISKQYDHIVQGGAVLGPLHGKGRVNADASVTKPFLETEKAIICSQGITAKYSQIDTYHMAASAIDTAIRNNIAIGGNLDHMALMDNFCWCSSTEKERLGELKSAAKACYDYAKQYSTPYISGKDSMFNDFKGFDKNANPIKISALPTLLISSISVTNDVTKTISIDPKFAEDLVYILGETKQEIGGSEYLEENRFIGNSVPQVDATAAIKTYRAFMKASDERLISSSISINAGGLGVALAKKAISGQFGIEIEIEKIPGNLERADYTLFSETQSRLLVTINPANKEHFEKHFENTIFAQIGTVTNEKKLKIKSGETLLIDLPIEQLDESYRKTFKNY